MTAKSKSMQPRSPKPVKSSDIEELIRRRAYELYEQRGRVDGFALDNLLQYARAGRQDDARATLEAVQALAQKQFVSPHGIASYYAVIGDNKRALDWLEKAYSERDATRCGSRCIRGSMVCEGSRGFAISLRACDLIREPERKSMPGHLLHDGVTAEWQAVAED